MSIWNWFRGRRAGLASSPTPDAKPTRPSNPATGSGPPLTVSSSQQTGTDLPIGQAKEQRTEAPSSREFGRLVDHHRRIIGVWVQHAEDTEDPVTLSLYLRELGAPESLCHAALDGKLTVTPNHRDSRGGYLIHVETA